MAGQIFPLHPRLPSISMTKCGSHTWSKIPYRQVLTHRASKWILMRCAAEMSQSGIFSSASNRILDDSPVTMARLLILFLEASENQSRIDEWIIEIISITYKPLSQQFILYYVNNLYRQRLAHWKRHNSDGHMYLGHYWTLRSYS